MKKAISKLFVAALGAGGMYFLDPDRGRSRRARAKDQLGGLVRRNVKEASLAVGREVRYAEGVAQGMAAKAAGGGHYRPKSETDLREHLRQVVAELRFPTTNVTVDVAEGVATLRGEVASPDEADAVVKQVSSVAGVLRVENFLHLPGEPAPNKVAAQQASGQAAPGAAPPGPPS